MEGWQRNWAKSSALRSRIVAFRLVLCIPLLFICYRLYDLQILQHTELSERASNQRQRVRKVSALRGEIHDQTGRPLVQNAPLFQLWAEPTLTSSDIEVELLQNVFGYSTEDVRNLFYRNKARRVGTKTLLIDNVPYEKAAPILARQDKLAHIEMQTTFQRDYLDPAAASHILGYIGEANSRDLEENPLRYSSGDRVGKQGIEKVFDRELFGANDYEIIRVDAAGFKIETLQEANPVHGSTVTLSINYEIQKHLFEQLSEHRAASAMVFDIQTGEVLAVASYPPLPLDEFRYRIESKTWQGLNQHPDRPLINRPFLGIYPPGSTYKPVVLLAALQEGLTTPGETVTCTGSKRIGNRRFRCWNRYGHGKVDAIRSLKVSCDIYYYEMGLRLGVDAIARYAKLLGLGRETGVELVHEGRGLIPTSQYTQTKFGQPWQPGDTAAISIGQGFNLTTPAQVARLYGSLANGVVTDLTLKKNNQPKRAKLPIDEEHLQLVRNALYSVVHEAGGTGGRARDRTIEISGKTGTSQVVSNQDLDLSVEDTEYNKRDHAWFAAFAPSKNPRWAAVALVEHGGHGGSTAAPIVRSILHTTQKVLNAQ
jgi:penicillin-binding protein 2